VLLCSLCAELTDESTKCCSACFNRIARRLGASAQPEPLVPSSTEPAPQPQPMEGGKTGTSLLGDMHVSYYLADQYFYIHFVRLISLILFAYFV